MNIRLITEYSPWFYPLCLILGFLYAFLLYYKDNKLEDAPGLLKKLLFLIRFLSVSFISFLLFAPLINSWISKTEKPSLVFAFDNSESIIIQIDTSTDFPNINAEIVKIQNQLSNDFIIRNYLFGENLYEAEKANFTDKYTDISAMIENIEDLYFNRNLGAVVLISDGNYNHGINPSYKVRDVNFPIYTISLGDSIQKPDLVIREIENNDIAYLGDNFPIRINILASKFRNNSINLEILHKNKVIAAKKYQITGDEEYIESELFIKATVAGLQQYTVRLLPIENEQNIKNNRKDIFIEILDSKKSVLIVSHSPHPDIAAISGALRTNKNVEVSEISIREKISDLKKYNLIILHQLPSGSNDLQLLSEQINSFEIPVLYIVGQKTSLIDLNKTVGLKINKRVAKEFEEIYPAVNNKFVAFKLSDELIELIDKLPPLLVPFGDQNQISGSETLFFQKIRNIITNEPLISFYKNQEIKFGIIHGEGLWRWKIYDYKINGSNEIFNDVVNKIVQYLSLNIKKEQLYINVNKSFNENEKVKFIAEVYNKNYEFVTDTEVELVITDQKGNEYPYSFVFSLDKYKLDAGYFKQGIYKYTSKTKLGNETLVKKGSFIVKHVNIEYQRTSANTQLLKQIAYTTKGKYFSVDNLNKLGTILLENKEIRSSSYIDNNYIDLINMKILFFILLLLLSIEWFFRKYYGGI